MKPVSEKNSDMDKQKIAPVIHERPKMPRATWEALRNHIIKERKRKQDEEGKAEENERLKRERENKKKQEANSLEETKEQISKLEDKLTSLKEEKHQLFLTLKKVLNEDDTRRRKETSEQNILYPQHGTPIFPLTGHMALNNPQLTAMYMQPQSRQPAMYLKPNGIPTAVPAAQPINKRQRTPSPPRSQMMTTTVSSMPYRHPAPVTAGGRIATSSVYGHPSASPGPIYAMSTGSSSPLHYPGGSGQPVSAREEERRQQVYLSQQAGARYVNSIHQQLEAANKSNYSERDGRARQSTAPTAHSQQPLSLSTTRGSITSGFPVQRGVPASYPSGTSLASSMMTTAAGHSLPPRLAYSQAAAAAQLAASQQAAAQIVASQQALVASQQAAAAQLIASQQAAGQPTSRYYGGPAHGREG